MPGVTAVKNLFEFLFPPRCAFCRELLPEGNTAGVCCQCLKELPEIKDPRCRVCGAPMNSEFAMPYCAQCAKGRPFIKCFVPFVYTGNVRRSVSIMKFYSRPSAHRYFARRIADEMGGFRPDFITYVPQNRKSLMQRGYNQTQLIAAELGRILKIPVRGTLIRKNEGRHQVGLSASERKRNAKKLYLKGKRQLSGTWLIVDDVITTGATMDACCSLLLQMGCREVYAAAAAKTVTDGRYSL